MTGSSSTRAWWNPTASLARGKASSASAPPRRASRAIATEFAPATMTLSGRAARHVPSTTSRWAGVRCGPRPVCAHTATPATCWLAIQSASRCWASSASAVPRKGTGTAGISPHSRREDSSSTLVAGGSGETILDVPRLDGGAILLGQVQQVQLRHRVLRQAQRLPGPEDEAVRSDRPQHRGQMVFRRPPDPADVPPQPLPLGGRRPPVHFLDEAAVGVRNQQAQILVAADQGTDARGGEVGDDVVGVALPAV